VAPNEVDRIARLAVLIDHLRQKLRAHHVLEAGRPCWPMAVPNHPCVQNPLNDLTLLDRPHCLLDQSRRSAQAYFPTLWIDCPLTLAGYPTSRLQTDAGAGNQRSCDLPWVHTTARAGTSPMFRPKNCGNTRLHRAVCPSTDIRRIGNPACPSSRSRT
jgi:hypothetical protein